MNKFPDSFVWRRDIVTFSGNISAPQNKSSRKRWWRFLCSLHVIFVFVLLVCVVFTTGVAWGIIVSVAEQNAAEMAEQVTRTNAKSRKQLMLSSLQDSMYFTMIDQLWASELLNESSIDWPLLTKIVLPELIQRQLNRPYSSVTGVATSSNLFVGITVEHPGLPNERWILLTANGTGAPLLTQIVWPVGAGGYDVIVTQPLPAVPFNVTCRQFYTEAGPIPRYQPAYYSGATSVPYLFAGARASNGSLDVVFVNGVRPDQFAEKMVSNVSIGGRLYVVERNGRGALLVASHGSVFSVVGKQAVPVRAIESPDDLVRDSAQHVLLDSGSWSSVPAYSRHKLPDGFDYFILTEHIQTSGLDYVVVDVTPCDVILHSVSKGTRQTMVSCGCLLALDAVVVVFLAILLTRPLSRISQGMTDLAELNFDEIDRYQRKSKDRSTITQLSTIERSLRKLQTCIQSFSLYVPVTLVHTLINDANRGRAFMETRVVTIAFIDIVKFATLCQQQTPSGLLLILTQYFDAISEAITSNSGEIDKYIGDCVMAIWNAPQLTEAHERNAMNAVFRIYASMRNLQQTLRHAMPLPMDFRIGIHTSEVMVGALGSSMRLSYTCVGSGVNIAARLLPMNNELGTRTLVSVETANAVMTEFLFRFVASVRLLGSKNDIEVYEPLAKSVSTLEPTVSVASERQRRNPLLSPHGSIGEEILVLPISVSSDDEQIVNPTPFAGAGDVCEMFSEVVPRPRLCDYADSFSTVSRMYSYGRFPQAHHLLQGLLKKRFGVDLALDLLSLRIEKSINTAQEGECTGVVIQSFK